MVELIFPIVGHSFLSPDGVFARIERSVKKKEVIADPNDYIKVFTEYATVPIIESGLVYDSNNKSCESSRTMAFSI